MRGEGSEAVGDGPSPARTGATNSRSLSTRSASRKAEASVGPPSSSRDWTPSAPSAPAPRPACPFAAPGRGPPAAAPSRRQGAAAAPWASRRRGRRARQIGPRGPASNGDRVDLRAQLVDEAAALLAGHPACSGDDDPAVEGRGHLVDHERAPLPHPGAPCLVLDACVPRVDELDVDALRAQPRLATGRLRVRIVRPEDDALDARSEYRLGAGRRRAVMRARLERHVHRGVARTVSCRCERDDLGVPAGRLGDAFADDLALADDHRANRRLRIRPLSGRGNELDRAADAHASRSTSSR